MKSKVCKPVQHIWSFLLALAIILVLLGQSISLNSQDLNYFHNFQKDNAISEVTGRSQEELDVISRDLTTYLQVGKDELLTKHFNSKEVAHMRDVFGLYELNRKVINYAFTFVVISLILTIYWKVRPSIFKKTLLYIGIIIGLIIILALVISGDFNKYFTIFHEIFFDNDLWMLNPETDLMIQMLPLNFFIGIVLKIFVFFTISLIVTIILMAIDIRLAKNNKECSLCSLQEIE